MSNVNESQSNEEVEEELKERIGIYVRLEQEVNDEFRNAAVHVYKPRGGFLQTAVTEAIHIWLTANRFRDRLTEYNATNPEDKLTMNQLIEIALERFFAH